MTIIDVTYKANIKNRFTPEIQKSMKKTANRWSGD